MGRFRQVREFLRRHYEWVLALAFFVILWRWAGFLVPYIKVDAFDEMATIASAMDRVTYPLAIGYRMWFKLLSFCSGSRDLLYLNDLNTQLLLTLVPGFLFLYLLSIRADVVSILATLFMATMVYSGMLPPNKNLQFVFLVLLVSFFISSRMPAARGRLAVLGGLLIVLLTRSEYVISIGFAAFLVARELAFGSLGSVRPALKRWAPVLLGLLCFGLGRAVLSPAQYSTNSASVFYLAAENHYRDHIRLTIPNWSQSGALDHVPDFRERFGNAESLREVIWKKPGLFARHVAENFANIPFRIYEDFLMNATWTSPVAGLWFLLILYLALLAAVVHGRRSRLEGPWVRSGIDRRRLVEHFVLMLLPAVAVSFIYLATFRYLLPLVMVLPAVVVGLLMDVDLPSRSKRAVLTVFVLGFLVAPKPLLFPGALQGVTMHQVGDFVKTFPEKKDLRILSIEDISMLLPFDLNDRPPQQAAIREFFKSRSAGWFDEFDVVCDGFLFADFLQRLGPQYREALEELRRDPAKLGFRRQTLDTMEPVVFYLRESVFR